MGGKGRDSKTFFLFDKRVYIKELAPDEAPSLETQVVDIADEIAYDNHDIDDGITSGLIKKEEISRIPVWKKIEKIILSKRYNNLDTNKKKYMAIRLLIDMQVTDLINATEKRIKNINPRSYIDIKKEGANIVGFSKEMLELRKPLREFLVTKLYRHYRVMRMSIKAKRFIKDLFNLYVDNPEQLPTERQKRINADNTRQVVCDYIADMTDRYALNEYKKLFDPHEKV